ncbi:MAG TPA: hypothetical protein VGO93_05150 [Candidatus Xenobia bacterium]
MKSRGYVEVGQVFGWIVFLSIAAAVIYYGSELHDSYHGGWTKGHAEGLAYAASPDGHLHGQNFERHLMEYLHAHRDPFPNVTLKDKAYNQGWDDGFHDIADKILR